MARPDGRRANELRPVEIIRRFTKSSPGSVLIRWGDTHVLCTASWEIGVPKWKKGQGTGWVTAEYDMLPGSTTDRKRRNRTKVDGRTQEIQRLIGRCLRAVIDFEALEENTITIDCDVLQADGGTRTASITGAYVAVCDAMKWARKQKLIRSWPVLDSIAAVSIGRVKGHIVADLNYIEDSNAEVDLNVAMTGAGEFVEVQGTGEGATFSRAELDKMTRLAARSIKQLQDLQAKTLRKRLPS